MVASVASERVLVVLPASPIRSGLRDWLAGEGFEVRDAAVWEVDRLVATGTADVVVTCAELDGEWGWSRRPGATVVVLALRPPTTAG